MDRHNRLAELLVKWEATTSRGNPQTPEELCKDCPELLPSFRELIRASAGLDDLLGSGPQQKPATRTVDAPIDFDAGRYKPFATIGTGGQGIVYMAEDREVGRTVALKVMKQMSLLGAGGRDQFVREAEITGYLEHPGIVPIYGLGRDEDGRPYYAMRYVRQDDLRKQIETYHSAPTGSDDRAKEFRRLLLAFINVCQTIAYSHSRGIIHRDIKPANVLLGPYGETAVVDWGLAKRLASSDPEETSDPFLESIEQDDQDSEKRSIMGLAKGTPAYMGPEQARGDWNIVGPASDIFSLGATLYTILAGRPPYTGRTAMEDAKAHRFEPPRQHKSDVPRALEAIVLKAMAKEPADRYTDAKALAADVERWIADEPVTAWREPFTIRARRWVKAHRTLVTTASSVATAAAVLIAGSAIFIAEKNRQLSRSNQEILDKNVKLDEQFREIVQKGTQLLKQNTEITAQKGELAQKNVQLTAAYTTTKQNFLLADKAVRGSVAAVNTRLPGGTAVADPIRIGINEQARDYYREFIKRNAGSQELARELAFAHMAEGEAEYGLQNPAAAMPLLEEARRRFQLLQSDRPPDPELIYGLARTNQVIGEILTYDLKVEAAKPYVTRACEGYAQLCSLPKLDSPLFEGFNDPAIRFALAVLQLRDVSAHANPRLSKDAAAGISSPPVEDPKGDGPVLPWATKSEKALMAYVEKAADIPPDIHALLGSLLLIRGEELLIRDRVKEGEPALRRARVEMDVALKGLPEAYELDATCGLLNQYLALLDRESGDREGANKRLIASRDHLRALGSRDWGVDLHSVKNRAWLFAALSSTTLGEWALRDGNPKTAIKYCKDAIEDIKHVGDAPQLGELSLRIPLLECLAKALNLVRNITDDEAMPLARPIVERMRKEMTALAPHLGRLPWFRRERLYFDSMLAMCKTFDMEDALSILDPTIEEQKKFVKEFPDDSLAQFQFAMSLMMRGTALVLKDRFAEALADLQASRAELVKVPSEGPGVHPLVKPAYRQVDGMTALIHASLAEEALSAKPPNRIKAKTHIDAGMAILDQSEKKNGPLNEMENQARLLLRQLRIQAGP